MGKECIDYVRANLGTPEANELLREYSSLKSFLTCLGAISKLQELYESTGTQPETFGYNLLLADHYFYKIERISHENLTPIDMKKFLYITNNLQEAGRDVESPDAYEGLSFTKDDLDYLRRQSAFRVAKNAYDSIGTPKYRDRQQAELLQTVFQMAALADGSAGDREVASRLNIALEEFSQTQDILWGLEA